MYEPCAWKGCEEQAHVGWCGEWLCVQHYELAVERVEQLTVAMCELDRRERRSDRIDKLAQAIIAFCAGLGCGGLLRWWW